MYALVTNDLQYAAANKHQERKNSYERVSENIRCILNLARENNFPVIHLLLTVNENDKRSIGKPPEETFIKGSLGHRVISELSEESDILLEKPKDSGFFETNLDELLKSLKVKKVVLLGMQTQICIQTTAADAHFRGYEVIVPRDCVCSTRIEDTESALKWLDSYCAKVTDSKSLSKQLDGEQIA